MQELVVRYTKEKQGTSLLMELGGLVRHICVEGVEYLRRHGERRGDVWMVQFVYARGRREEFVVVDEPDELSARALAYMFLGEMPIQSAAVRMEKVDAERVRELMDASPFVV